MSEGVQTTKKDENYYRSLDITNDYMFMTVLNQHPDICLQLLRYMLPHIQINRVEYKQLKGLDVIPAQPNVQHVFSPGTDVHGVRLDVFHDDGERMFDVEMHTGKDGQNEFLPKRTRYTHSSIDAIALKRGESYHKLRPCYVIYICTFDMFGKGLYLYTVRNHVVEAPSIGYNDESYTLYFNAKGTVGKIPKVMKEILRYIRNPELYPIKKTKIEVIKQIDTAVKYNRQSPEWRLEFDMLTLFQQDAELRGEKRGKRDLLKDSVEKALSSELYTTIGMQVLYSTIAAPQDEIDKVVAELKKEYPGRYM